MPETCYNIVFLIPTLIAISITLGLDYGIKKNECGFDIERPGFVSQLGDYYSATMRP